MTIQYVPEDYKDKNTYVTPRIEFEDFDGCLYAAIYIDDVCIAYFSENGRIVLSEFEIRPSWEKDDTDVVEYLKNKGFKLRKIKPIDRYGDIGEGCVNYVVDVE